MTAIILYTDCIVSERIYIAYITTTHITICMIDLYVFDRVFRIQFLKIFRDSCEFVTPNQFMLFE